MADEEDRSDKFTTQEGEVQFLSEKQINELRAKDDPLGEGDDELSLDEIDEDDLEEPEDEE